LGVISALAADAITRKAMKKAPAANDGTAALIGLLLAMILPAGAPWWAVIIGAAMAIFIGRSMYGGLGGNPFNPVLVGWAVLNLSWAAATKVFVEPICLTQGWAAIVPLDFSETPLGLLDFGDPGQMIDAYGWWPLLSGGVPGGLGSTSALALLLGGLYLVNKRVIPWQIPLSFLGGQLAFGLIFWLVDPSTFANPLHHMVAGYTMIGAFFLAADMTTSPYTGPAMILYGLGIGVMTMIVRYWGTSQEGVLYAILFFNILTPVLDRIRLKTYGLVKAAG
jgi:electron transport complex protein RnfD